MVSASHRGLRRRSFLSQHAEVEIVPAANRSASASRWTSRIHGPQPFRRKIPRRAIPGDDRLHLHGGCPWGVDLVLGSASVPANQSPASAKPIKPNILFVLADQWRLKPSATREILT